MVYLNRFPFFVFLAINIHHSCSTLDIPSHSSSNFNTKPIANAIIGPAATTAFTSNRKKNYSDTIPSPHTHSFSIPLVTARPKPESFLKTLNELWNDPRPVTSLIRTNDRSKVGKKENSATGQIEDIPYCIISDNIHVGILGVEGVQDDDENQKACFQILLYPRGRFYGSVTSDEEEASGQAAAFLRYLPTEYGDEVDVSWRLRLVDTMTNKTLPIMSSGGLPKSNDTWSAAMTMCTETEAVEGVGRATDWGSSTWFAKSVCGAIGNLKAEGEITVYESRKGESMASWPLKGGLGAVLKTITSESSAVCREFRVGEVIIPIFRNDDDNSYRKKLEELCVYPGIDYRIMTMTDGYGNPIFSTSLLSKDEMQNVRLALRPCGWKMQSQLYSKKSTMNPEWPVEVDSSLLSSNSVSRFNPSSAIPRITSAFARDYVGYLLAIILALSPIPITLLGRNAVSLYVIPSASMEPTLLKGDVLLVEKLPGVLDRTKRGDIILFKPPDSLLDVIASNGGTSISSSSLFVKRIVGLPGDKDIIMNQQTKEVIINGEPAAGPNRNLCKDEPLKLIDRLLENGKGKSLSVLKDEDVYVLGDCKSVSVDSRVFGVLPKKNIIGKPLARLWPLGRLSSGNL